jgi:hypothetical protein
MIYEQYKDQPLNEVLESGQQVHEEFLAAFDPISDKELNEPSCFEEMPPDWIPWKVIASNTFEHYREHILDIEDWLSSKGK